MPPPPSAPRPPPSLSGTPASSGAPASSGTPASSGKPASSGSRGASFRNLDGQPIGFPVADWTPPSWPSAETLVGRWCRLDRLDANRHAEPLYQSLVEDRVAARWTYLGYGPFADRATWGEWLAGQETTRDPRFYAILDRTGRAVGLASYLRITPVAGTIEIGHLVFSSTLSRTVAATEAIFLLLDSAFQLGYRRVEWKCDSLNEPSRRAAERFGFQWEGDFRQALVYKGRNRDTSWYAMLDGEWPALRASYQRWLAPDNFDPTGLQRLRLQDCRS